MVLVVGKVDVIIYYFQPFNIVRRNKVKILENSSRILSYIIKEQKIFK